MAVGETEQDAETELGGETARARVDVLILVALEDELAAVLEQGVAAGVSFPAEPVRDRSGLWCPRARRLGVVASWQCAARRPKRR
ncbi:MAG: hypothetical protein R3B70_15705 [Polyangiaceae bacterium]